MAKIWFLFSLLFLFNSFTFWILGLNVAAFGTILLIGEFTFWSPILLFILLTSGGIFLMLILFPKEFILFSKLFDEERFIWLFITGPLIPLLKGLLLPKLELVLLFSGGNFLMKVFLPMILSFKLFWFWFCCFKACSKPIVLFEGFSLLNFVIDNSWNLPSSSSSSSSRLATEKGIWFELEFLFR